MKTDFFLELQAYAVPNCGCYPFKERFVQNESFIFKEYILYVTDCITNPLARPPKAKSIDALVSYVSQHFKFDKWSYRSAEYYGWVKFTNLRISPTINELNDLFNIHQEA